jgi:hypothetical protein
MNGWTEDALAANLRADPSYKFSPEAQARSVGILDAMGMFVGRRAVLKLDPKAALPKSTNLAQQIKTADQLKPALPYKPTLGKKV